MSSEVSKIKKKRQSLFRSFLFVVLVLVSINIIAYQWYAQLDLTADKRYSTTRATTQMLKELKGNVNVTVFLAGKKLPAAFKNLAYGTEELLKTFSNESHRKVIYQFVDPVDNEDAVNTLRQYGMTGFPVTVNDDGGMQQRLVYPWALVTYIPENGAEARSVPVMLQESNSMVLNKQILLRSEIMLEYNLGNTIRQLSKAKDDMVAYLTGNGEPTSAEMLSLARNVGIARYGMDSLNLQSVTNIPASYKAMLIVKPTIPFSELDLFKIDQYIMQGGRVLFALDATLANIDSFQHSGTFTATPLNTGLNELLFPYGARVNNDLVLDATTNAGIPVAVGGEAQPQKYSWPYFPVLEGNEQLALTKNLQGVLARFPSSIDLNKNNDAKVKKMPLLSSSVYTKTVGLPAVVMYNQSILETPNLATFNKKNVVVAALLEGTFVSPFAQQHSDALNAFIDQHQLIVKNQSAANAKLIVLSDADILLNEVGENGPMELGAYRFEKGFRFDNAAFFQNSLTYLIDDHNLLEARTKNFQSRILDPKRVAEEATKWQFLAIGVPVMLVGILGLIYTYIRKRKYAK
ncbi:MAG: gliding motility-associated ABC transporter substrate-binding protein GldG [Sphingobacteriales bacterium]|nr:MAG: gliding motility-associated ABC transporter substrate-binding protein GldG [Sphingobacteriales bacterium]